MRSELRVEIKRLHAQLGSTTMIYVTHDQIEALTLADRIAVMKDQKIQQLGTPHEIYNRPANIFVAGFVGSPRMNFVEGRIEGGEVPSFAVGQHRLALDGYAFARRVEPGHAVTLGVRPEHLVIDGGGGWSGFTVDVVEPMGADNLVWCKNGGLSLEVRTAAERTIEPGARLTLGLDARRVSLFDSATGERL